ncbi:MAG: hypothetical protein ACJAV1_001216 [Paraglaciecola sp.]
MHSFNEKNSLKKSRGLGSGLAGLLSKNTNYQPPKVTLGSDFETMEEEVSNFADVITEYLATRLNCKVIKKIDRQRMFFEANGLDLMFRYKFGSSISLDNNLLIARIEFPTVRVGHGTNFLKKLTDIACTYAIENITIESVNSNSRAFALLLDVS